MILFGKSATNMEVTAADLLPDGKDLYIIAADADCNLHILQYDPERSSPTFCTICWSVFADWVADPKSLHGHLLLHRTSFSLGGHLPTTLGLPRTSSTTLLPATSEAMNTEADATIPEHQLLITSQSGAISLRCRNPNTGG